MSFRIAVYRCLPPLLLFFLQLWIVLPTDTVLAEETEEAAFDVFLGKEYRGLLAAKYSPDIKSTWVEVSNPRDVLSLVPALKDPEKLVRLLSQRISKEASDDEIGSVVVSPKSFSISLTIKPEELVGTSLGDNGKLLKVDETLSFRQDLTGSLIAGAQNAKTLTSTTAFNFSHGWLYSNFAQFSEGRANLQELTANSKVGRYRVSAGGIRTPGYQLQPSLDLYGMGIGTVTELLPLDRALRGNQLKIFVPVPGRVEFFRSGALIDSQLLQYGLQEIDTTRFPDGGYYIDIVYPGANGGNQREKRYFSRSGLLVPRGYPSLTFNAGTLRDQFTQLDTQAATTHLEWRLLDWLQLELGGYSLESKSAGIAGFRGIVGDTVFGSSVAAPSGGDLGYSFLLTGSLLGVGFGGTYEKSSFLDLPLEDTLEVQNPINLPVNQSGQRERFLRAGESYNFTFSKRIDPVEFLYEAYGTKDELITEYFYRGPTVRWQIYEAEKTSVNFQVSRYDTQNGVRSYALLTFMHRFDKWQEQAQGSYTKDATRKDRVLSNYLNYDDRQQRTGLGTRAQLRNELRAQPGAAQGNASLDVSRGFRPGSIALYGQQSGDLDAGESQTPTGAASIGSSFTIGEKGDVSLSPPDLGYSVVVVHLAGQSEEIEMEILIDESVSGVVRGGGSVALGISPYLTHKIRIRPTEGSSLVYYDTVSRQISVNPGGVVHMKFGTERVIVVLGQIVDDKGAPLAFKRVSGAKDAPLTEADGAFQIELQGDEHLSVQNGSETCQLVLPPLNEVQYFLDLGRIVCSAKKE